MSDDLARELASRINNMVVIGMGDRFTQQEKVTVLECLSDSVSQILTFVQHKILEGIIVSMELDLLSTHESIRERLAILKKKLDEQSEQKKT